MFEEDRVGIILAREGLMWARTTRLRRAHSPNSQEALGKDSCGLPESDKYKLVVGNAAQLYELN